MVSTRRAREHLLSLVFTGMYGPTNTLMATHLRYWFGVSESMFTLFMALTSEWACSIAWKLKLDVSKAVVDCNRMNVGTGRSEDFLPDWQ